MKLKRKIISVIAAGALCMESVLACANGAIDNVIRNDSNTKKYALIFAPGKNDDEKILKDSFDEGTKNSFLIAIANIYNSLKKAGYNKIEVLYNDGTIDKSEQRDHDKIEALANEQFTNQRRAATSENLDSMIGQFKETIKEDDEFVFVMMNHGHKDGLTSYIEVFPKRGEKDRLYPEQLLEKVTGIRAKKQLYVIEACYSGHFGDVLGTGNRAVLTSSESYSPSIISRVDQFSRFFFDALVNDGSDKDNDCKISISEAFENAEKRRKPYLGQHEKEGHLKFYKRNGFFGKSYNLRTNNHIMYRIKR